MYSVKGRSWVAMGDPVGQPGAGEELAREFHERCTRAGGRTVFYQVKPENLHVYVDMGLSFVKLGEEGRVPLTNFSLQGRARKNLRHMLNKAKDAKYSFRMVPAAETAALMPQLRAISDAWLSARNLREKGFSLGFFDESYLAGFPIAVVEQDGKPVAFANLWPGADRAELSIDLMRHLPDASNGVMDMLFIELMLWGAAQGYQWFNLGMAPLSGLDDSSLAPLWSRFGAMIYQHGENFYNFRGLRNYKEKFDPIWEPRYLACPGGLALPRILAEVTTLISRGVKGRKEIKGA
jgi:phosphatidylglycerol lysyltransferase